MEAYVLIGGGIFFMAHATIMPTSEHLSLISAFVGCLDVGVVLWGFACNKNGYNKIAATAYRLGACAGMLYVSEMLEFNTLIFRIQVAVLLIGCLGPWFGIISECAAVVFLYFDMTTYLETVDDGLFYWCMIVGFGLVVVSGTITIFLMYDEFDADQRRFLMRLHFQDWSMGLFCVVLAGVLKKADYLGEGTLGAWLAKWSPVIFVFFTNQSKDLIRRRTAPPHHPTWWVDSTWKFQDESDLVNVAFSISTAFATIILTVLCVIVLVKSIGLEKMQWGEPSLSLFCIMHGFMIVVHSGFWMIFASSGIPPTGRARMFRLFPPDTGGPFLACDPKNCIWPHKFDIVTGLISAGLGAFAQESAFKASEVAAVKKIVIAVWVISIANKVFVHIKDFGYVPACKPNPYHVLNEMDHKAKDGAKVEKKTT